MGQVAFNKFTYEDVKNVLSSALLTLTGNDLNFYETQAKEEISFDIVESIQNQLVAHIDDMIGLINGRIDNRLGKVEEDSFKKFIQCYKNWKNAFSDIFLEFNSKYLNKYKFSPKGAWELFPTEDEYDKLNEQLTQEYLSSERNIMTDTLKELDVVGKISEIQHTDNFLKLIVKTKRDKYKDLDQTVFRGKMKGFGGVIRINANYDEKLGALVLSTKWTEKGGTGDFIRKYASVLLNSAGLKAAQSKAVSDTISRDEALTIFLKDPIVEKIKAQSTYGKFFNKGLDQVNIGNISVGANKSLFMGAMGEAYWYGFFYYAMSESGIKMSEQDLKAAGVALKSRAGQEVPIDIIFNRLGIQVKNLSRTVSSTTHVGAAKVRLTSESDTTLSKFLTTPGLGKVGLGEGAVEILGNFFFAEFYNRPNPKFADDNTTPTYTDYKNLYGYFSAIQAQNEALIMGLIPRIISIDKDLRIALKDTVESKLRDEEGDIDGVFVGMPDLFIIGDRIFKSSTLLGDIKKVIKNNFNLSKQKDDTAFEITSFKLNISPFERAVGNKIYNDDITADVNSLMEESKISFSIYFNFILPDIAGDR